MADKTATNQDLTELLMEEFKAKGVSVSTVADGHVILITRGYLQKLLDTHPTNDEFVLFLKRPDPKKAS